MYHKLEAYGITDPVLTFLKHYLTGREFVVYARETFSLRKITKQGVPQGSILGPLIFSLYINDLQDVTDLCHNVLYTDNTTISVHDK